MSRLFAVVGMSGSGKSVITSYLEEHNWKKVYMGSITYKLMEEAGIERTIDGVSEKKFRENMRKEYGPECYAKFIEEDIRKEFPKGNVVIDGLYSWYEYKYLVEKFPSLELICIVANKRLRYERVSKRKERPFDEDAIRFRDLAEIENLYKGGPIAYADYYILNNGSIENTIDQLKQILEEV